MGTKKRKPSNREPVGSGVADALFTKVQQRVLAVLFGNHARSFYANELIALACSGSGAVQRELAQLQAAELVTVETEELPVRLDGHALEKRRIVGDRHGEPRDRSVRAGNRRLPPVARAQAEGRRSAGRSPRRQPRCPG